MAAIFAKCLRNALLISTDPLYTGEVYRVSSASIPWQITLNPPAIILADSERTLPYCGYPHYSHLTTAIHQFSAGVRAARLDDANFEHDTQASTGSTTGSWLIVFDTLSYQTSQLYDGLSLSLRSRGVSLGVVDPTQSIRTAKRFNVNPKSFHHPVLIVLHRGQLYRFLDHVERTQLERVIEFAVDGFRRHPPSVIPRPRLRFDEFLDWTVEYYMGLEVSYGPELVLVLTVAFIVSVAIAVGLAFVSCFWYAGALQHNGFEEATPTPSPYEAGDDGSTTPKKSKSD